MLDIVKTTINLSIFTDEYVCFFIINYLYKKNNKHEVNLYFYFI